MKNVIERFNSSLVLLEGVLTLTRLPGLRWFQFQLGSIRRGEENAVEVGLHLKFQFQLGSIRRSPEGLLVDHIDVSIPAWFY